LENEFFVNVRNLLNRPGERKEEECIVFCQRMVEDFLPLLIPAVVELSPAALGRAGIHL
jgi:hypothetical protein